MEGQENIQEVLSKQLLLCQFLTALSTVRTGVWVHSFSVGGDGGGAGATSIQVDLDLFLLQGVTLSVKASTSSLLSAWD